MFLLPGNGPRSSNSVRSPPRAASMAAHAPAGPAPTTTTSKSVSANVGRHLFDQCIDHRVGVGNNGEIGELHHRAERIGVDADDVLWPAETAGVLHCTTDAEGDVQIGVDRNAGGADLALVA